MKHDKRMVEVVENNVEVLPYETFIKTWNQIKSKPGKKYDFIVKGGEGLKEALFNLFQLVWEQEKIPEGWTVSTVTQISKGKPDINNPASLRHIHDKIDLMKMFLTVVMLNAKEVIYDNMSKFQIASEPGHRASENCYVLKSVFAY